MVLDGKICLQGMVHGVREDGTEYVVPFGSPGKQGTGGRYKIFRQATDDLVEAIHGWYENMGFEIPS